LKKLEESSFGAFKQIIVYRRIFAKLSRFRNEMHSTGGNNGNTDENLNFIKEEIVPGRPPIHLIESN
jgi:hypothetical protein